MVLDPQSILVAGIPAAAILIASGSYGSLLLLVLCYGLIFSLFTIQKKDEQRNQPPAEPQAAAAEVKELPVAKCEREYPQQRCSVDSNAAVVNPLSPVVAPESPSSTTPSKRHSPKSVAADFYRTPPYRDRRASRRSTIGSKTSLASALDGMPLESLFDSHHAQMRKASSDSKLRVSTRGRRSSGESDTQERPMLRPRIRLTIKNQTPTSSFSENIKALNVGGDGDSSHAGDSNRSLQSSDFEPGSWKCCDVEQWTKDDVATFIQSLGSNKEVWMGYAIKCILKHIDGKAILEMNELDFKAIGFKNVHARIVCRALQSEVDRPRFSISKLMPTVEENEHELEQKGEHMVDTKQHKELLDSKPKELLDTKSEIRGDAIQVEKKSTTIIIRTGDGSIRDRSSSPIEDRDDDDCGSVFTTHSEAKFVHMEFQEAHKKPAKCSKKFVEELVRVQPKTLDEMLQLRHDLHMQRRRDEENVEQGKKQQHRLDDSEDEEESASNWNSGYQLTNHNAGLLQRLFSTKTELDDETLLAWQSTPIKRSMIECNRKMDKVAVQMFKCVLGAMGDRRTSKSPEEHAQRLVLLGLLCNETMRDELFLHLCKQTFQHPKIENCVRGWNLLLLCLMSFAPSSNLKISHHIDRAIDIKGPSRIREQARLAKMALEIAQEQRCEMPLIEEISNVNTLSLTPVEIKLPFDEASSKYPSVVVFTFDPYMTIEEAELMIATRLKLKFTKPFGLFEANEHQSEYLLGSKRIGDILASWKNSIVDIKDALQIGDASKPSSRSRSASPVRRSRSHSPKKDKPGGDDEHAQALSFVATKSVTTVERKASRLRAKLRGHQKPYDRFTFQAKYRCPISDGYETKALEQDPVALDLMYGQVRKEVVEGHLRVNARDIPKFAALQLQVERDGVVNAQPGSLLSDIKRLVPKTAIPDDSEKLEKLEARIISKSKRLEGMTADQAKLRYLSYGELTPMYGAHIYRVRQQRQLRHLPDYLNLGISVNGIFIQNPEDGTIDRRYNLKEIVTWGCSRSKFILVVGNVVQQIKFSFKTFKGMEMKQLITEAVQLHVHHVKAMPQNRRQLLRARSYTDTLGSVSTRHHSL
mmetsp:Transcript_14297/g.28833  ORF Transcript_14297/g.28833 Transcript_14297/m.28833 type:complete len:1095 (-) Transcript_14297:107-3391(-)